MKRIKGHIVFDLDGTLVSSRDALINGLFEYLLQGQLNLETLKNNKIDSFKLFKDLEMGLAKKLIEAFGKVTSLPVFKYGPYPGIEGIIKHLSENDYKIYLWTMRDKKSSHHILNHLNLSEYFEDICSSSGSPLKPNPTGPLNMLIEANPMDVIIVGDSVIDKLGAQKLGCHFIHATWGKFIKRSSSSFWSASHPDKCLELIELYFFKKSQEIKKSA